MAKFITFNKTDLEDIITGATILGSGGGGARGEAEAALADILKHADEVLIVDPQDVEDDSMMAVTIYIGSSTAPGEDTDTFPIAAKSFDVLNNLQKVNSHRDFSYVVPGETGSTNSLVPMTIAVRKGIAVVDGDPAGRSVPDLTMNTLASNNVTISPIVTLNDLKQVILNVDSAADAEAPVRGIISDPAFGQTAAQSQWAMTGAVMKSSIIPNTLTYTRNLGCKLRETLASGGDPVAAVCDYLHARVLFKGRITAINQQTGGGFDFGTVVLNDGTVDLWLSNLNENMMAWRADSISPLALSPDIMSYITTDGVPFSNADIESYRDKEIVLLGSKVRPEMRDPRIIQYFVKVYQSIGYFGPYVPIEKLNNW